MKTVIVVTFDNSDPAVYEPAPGQTLEHLRNRLDAKFADDHHVEEILERELNWLR